MQTKTALRAEHKKACKEIEALTQKGIAAGTDRAPLDEDIGLYRQLNLIKETLEWIDPALIETTAKRGDPNYINALMEHKFYVHGPVNATLTWPPS